MRLKCLASSHACLLTFRHVWRSSRAVSMQCSAHVIRRCRRCGWAKYHNFLSLRLVVHQSKDRMYDLSAGDNHIVQVLTRLASPSSTHRAVPRAYLAAPPTSPSRALLALSSLSQLTDCWTLRPISVDLLQPSAKRHPPAARLPALNNATPWLRPTATTALRAGTLRMMPTGWIERLPWIWKTLRWPLSLMRQSLAVGKLFFFTN
jgi:hypothetical protein